MYQTAICLVLIAIFAAVVGVATYCENAKMEILMERGARYAQGK